MSRASETRAFQAAVGVVLVIPLVIGTAGAFGGLEAIARLLGVQEPIAAASPLRNSLRAICCMFLGYVPLGIWILGDIAGRATAFRIVCASGFLAGFARLTGWWGEGWPGAAGAFFMGVELAAIPLLVLWHARLVRRAVAPGGTS